MEIYDDDEVPLTSSSSNGLVLVFWVTSEGSEEVLLEVVRACLLSDSPSESKGFEPEILESTEVCLAFLCSGDFL